MVSIPYLRVPVFHHGEEIRFDRKSESGWTELELELVDRVFEGGADLDDLAQDVVDAGEARDLDEARERLRASFSMEDSVIGLMEIPLKDEYDVLLVEQGYGGVYVHTVELAKRLQRDHECLLLAPVKPLFGDAGIPSVTLAGLREHEPELTYFSYIHILRSIVRRTNCKLLLIAHRSQSLPLFDLIGEQPTVIYCDGFFDGMFRLSMDLKFPGGDRVKKRVLSEVYYLTSNNGRDYFGFTGTPLQNRFLLMAGYMSLRDARENWCWGRSQTNNFKEAFPKLRRPVRFMPPFTDPDLLQPEKVDRDRVVLFTTTMHNIEKKGFSELMKAMEALPDMRVRCVVRQPDRLPEYPRELDSRIEHGSVTKKEMVELYHRVWVNCRTSREESSPVSILEAMICEIPQIVSPVVAEQIPLMEDGKTGFIVDPDDEKGLARALETLLGDEELRDAMGAEARRRACEYSLEARARAFERYLA